MGFFFFGAMKTQELKSSPSAGITAEGLLVAASWRTGVRRGGERGCGFCTVRRTELRDTVTISMIRLRSDALPVTKSSSPWLQVSGSGFFWMPRALALRTRVDWDRPKTLAAL